MILVRARFTDLGRQFMGAFQAPLLSFTFTVLYDAVTAGSSKCIFSALFHFSVVFLSALLSIFVFTNFDCCLSYSRQEEYVEFASEITSCVLLKV